MSELVHDWSAPANPARGEACLRVAGAELVLRPSFQALVERAASGGLAFAELVALFWHCRRDPPPAQTREGFGEALATLGLAHLTPVLRVLLGQILSGR